MSQPNTDAIAGRIKFLINKINMSQAAFAKRLDIDPANMSKYLNGKLPISRGLIDRIAVDFGVSKQWLAHGDGLPFSKDARTKSPTIEDIDPSLIASPATPGGLPIYDIDVTAGAIELDRELASDRIVGSINVPGVRSDSMIVKVNGDSMTPVISDGAYVAIRRVNDLSCIFWGQIYVVVLDDYRMVKYVRRNPDTSCVTLHSVNPDYDDMEVPRDKIRALYLVESILNLKIQC